MNSFLIIFSALAAVTLANPTAFIVEHYSNGRRTCHMNCRPSRPHFPQSDCPAVNCPPPVRDGNCGTPDCSLSGNRLELHPHPDPNYFYQCAPGDATGPLVPVVRPCGCGTLFTLSVSPPRCVHPHEWVRDCPAQPQYPVLNDEWCATECPNCGDDGGNGGGNGPPTNPPVTLPPVTIEPETEAPPNGCDCPCAPCIWWPCMPCLPICACNGGQQQPQRPQPPLVQPPQNRPQIPIAPQPAQNPNWPQHPPWNPNWPTQPPQNPNWPQEPPQNPNWPQLEIPPWQQW